MSILITVFGIIGYLYLGVREFPAVDPPTITVTTTYRGAAADIIENQITEILEESINGISGIRDISSISREQQSTITVEFDLGTDLDVAANDVRDRVSRVAAACRWTPIRPTVAKADANAFPIIMVTVQSDKRDILDVTAIGTRMKDRLQTIPGVAEVRIWGEKKYAMRMWMDPEEAVGLRPHRGGREERPQCRERGSAFGPHRGPEYRARGAYHGPATTVEDFDNLIIKTDGSAIVRFKDIGHAELGAENERTILKNNGIPMIGLALTAQPGANNLAIAKEFYKRYEKLKDDVPDDVKIRLGFDSTRFIQRSIDEVKETIIFAFLLVLLIIFLFLRDWRTTIIPVLAIPGVPHRHLLLHVAGGVHHQCAHLAGHRAGHRPGGGRRHRGAGEHLRQDRAWDGSRRSGP